MSPDPKKPAWQAAQQRDWVAYYDRVAGKPPRDTLLAALDLFAREEGGAGDGGDRLAIDLGCGDGRDTIELLRRGWRVIAIDDHPEGLRRLRERTEVDVAGAIAAGRLEIRRTGFAEVGLEACEFVNASFSLPFCEPGIFGRLWGEIESAIAMGGRFAGQLFGERDSWSTIEDRTHHTRVEAVRLLDGFVLESFIEEEREGVDASSNHKHWHVFHVVGRKRG